MSYLPSKAARGLLRLLTSLAFIPLAFNISGAHALAQQTSVGPSPPAASAAPTQQREDAGAVVFSVTVTNNRGGYVTGLDKSNFSVLEDKAPQEITYFKGQDEPVSVGIILDVSRSMFDPRMRELMKTLFNEAILRFIQQGNRSNEYFLIGFNERPQLMADWTNDIKEINAALAKIGAVGPKGHSTAFYDACYLGAEKLARSRHPKRAMILISDGQDNASQYTFKELRQLVRESDMLVYAVGLSSAPDWSTLGLQGKGILDELAMSGGGVSLYPEKSSEVRHAFNLIAAELRHQYSIGFKPPARHPADREWHRIKIKLNLAADAPPELRHLSVRSREGYYANANRR
ncbi:MAG TPA: VWA domain-containing protein [Pyrinomonadaceae bacterium]|jgi:Ca-activated chloride channel family protein